MKLLLFLIVISAILWSSCTRQNDAKKASDQYCNCMIENGYPDQNLYAVTICHAQLIKKYRFYKLFFIDRRSDVLSQKMSMPTLDSARRFVKEFLKYTQIDKRKILRDLTLSDENRTDVEMLSLFEERSLNSIALPKPVMDKTKLKNGLVKEEINGYSETYYRNGKKDGLFKKYYKFSCELRVLGYYKNNEPFGEWFFFNENGEVFLIEDIKGVNKERKVRSNDGTWIKSPIMSYRKEYDTKTGRLKREGLALYFEDTEKGFYKYGKWKEYLN
ncbi:hypothetical protein ACSBL2_18910 [Pedobacter sp. AW31-3R]|uniref:hypothetical protein n=1 Tax=Pedobacter sp. AW31-3R TaxID=3445781 RepID=UPI003F9F5002